MPWPSERADPAQEPWSRATWSYSWISTNLTAAPSSSSPPDPQSEWQANGPRRIRTSSRAPRRREPAHLAVEQHRRSPRPGEHIRSGRADPLGVAMPVTIHLLDSAPMTNPPAAARVLFWLSWPEAPPGSTAYSDQGRPMARRSAFRAPRWRPVASRGLDLAWSTLQEWLEPRTDTKPPFAMCARTRSSGWRPCGGEQPARTPDKPGGSHDQHVTNSAREQTEAPENRPRQSEVINPNPG